MKEMILRVCVALVILVPIAILIVAVGFNPLQGYSLGIVASSVSVAIQSYLFKKASNG